MSSQAPSSDLSELSVTQFQDLMYEIHPAALAMAPPGSFSGSESSFQPSESESSHTSLGSTMPPTPSTTTDSDKSNRKRTSYVFKHMPNEDPETTYWHYRTRKPEWRCRYCNKHYALNGGTRIIKAHLKGSHSITDQSPREVTTKKRQLSLEDAMAAAQEHPRIRRKLRDHGDSIKGDPLEVLFIRLLATGNLPLRLVELGEFRDFLFYLNKDVDAFLPASHTTIQEWIIRQKDSQKERIIQKLHNARSIIHLSVDAGQSPNNHALLAIVAHYISEEGLLETSVLAVKEIDGAHNGPNMAGYVIEAIREYGIASKLGYFMGDNASSNDTLLGALSTGTCFLINI